MLASEIKEIKTATITDKGQICIPHIARTMNGFKEGSKVSIVVYAGKVEIMPMKQINDAMFAMLASEDALAEAWDTPEEDEAWKDL